MSKTKEIVFRHPSINHFLSPAPISDVAEISSAKLLGVILQNNLHFDEQITAFLKICSQRSYLLKMLRDQGLSKKNMDSVFHALILCKIRYALCAWGGHITEANKGQINAFLRRMHRYGYVSAVYNIDDLICAADAKLFSSVCIVHHCINYLLPEVKTSHYSLRKRDHHFELPSWHYSLLRNSFVIR